MQHNMSKTKILSALAAMIIAASTLTSSALAINYPTYTNTETIPEIQIPKKSNNIDNNTIIDVSDYIKPNKSNRKNYLINFSKTLSVGYAEDGTLVDCEAEYGLSGMTIDNKIVIKTYDHTTNKSTTETTFTHINTNSGFPIKLSENYALLNLQNPAQGIYQIKTKFKDKKTISLYLYITESKDIYVCDIMTCPPKTIKILQNRRNQLQKMAYMDPNENIDYKILTYPVENPTEKRPTENSLWIAKSNKICDPNDSQEYKVYKLYKWCINNIAYDFYRVNELQNKTRASRLNDYTGTYGTYKTLTGVCIDYANIFAIMCRYQGIPTVSIGSESKNHVWNAVFINNRWWELDLSNAAKYGVYEYTTERRTARKNIKSYDYFFNFIPHRSSNLPSDAVMDKYLYITR